MDVPIVGSVPRAVVLALVIASKDLVGSSTLISSISSRAAHFVPPVSAGEAVRTLDGAEARRRTWLACFRSSCRCYRWCSGRRLRAWNDLGPGGIPFSRMSDPNPLAFNRGRFVLYDGRRIATTRVRSMLSPAHTAIDIDGLRQGEATDPFLALIDIAHNVQDSGRQVTCRLRCRKGRDTAMPKHPDRLRQCDREGSGPDSPPIHTRTARRSIFALILMSRIPTITPGSLARGGRWMIVRLIS